MRRIYKDYLFSQRILISEGKTEPVKTLEALIGLASVDNVRIISGQELARPEMVEEIAYFYGDNVPLPFYEGFPTSVRALSRDQLLTDQLLHYLTTYGFNMFEEAGHSVFEEYLERAAFSEHSEPTEYRIVKEEDVEEMIREIVGNLLKSTRPLSEFQYDLVSTYLYDVDPDIEVCASKHTAVRLLEDLRRLKYCRFLMMSDVLKLVDEINYRKYDNTNPKKLNFRNQDRKFVASVMNELFKEKRCDIRTCCEKKALWNGLLHHIHYQPKDDYVAHFVSVMRGKENLSVFSEFEKAMAEKDIEGAVRILKEGKSEAMVLRSLNYILSRCTTPEETEKVISQLSSGNIPVLIQLLISYADYKSSKEPRTFSFTKDSMLLTHKETEEETARRRSVIGKAQVEAVSRKISENLQNVLRNRLDKVYIDPDMRRMALPLQETTSQGGVGVLTKGSRLPIPEGKKIRAFTYWEKVNDIDLSVFGLDEEGRQTEFSWRTMYYNQSQAVTYSGDETSGYNGGSEYFDIDVEAFKALYPHIKKLVFCNNVYSGTNFAQCFCKAGYMVRDIFDSGEIFELKTVQSSYRVNCESTFAYLFGIDLETREFIWLNMTRAGQFTVAGTSSMDFLLRYFSVTSAINMYTFFEMMAAEVVSDPALADVIVSDKAYEGIEGKEQIRSTDFDKVLALMNQ